MTRDEKISYIREYLNGKVNGREVTKKQAQQLYTYYEMLVEKNQVMNLTAITEFAEVVEKHYYDSMLAKISDEALSSAAKLIDVGTGAGFPGLPLKILYPELQVTLMDSLNKRCLFLEEVIKALGLTGIEVIHSRAEELGRNPAHREAYDFAVSRAVANLATLSEYCVPFVKVGGCFISYKSGTVEEELAEAKNAIFLLGAGVEEVQKEQLPDSKADRSLVYIRKRQGTPKKYPRKAGTPSKDPLK